MSTSRYNHPPANVVKSELLDALRTLKIDESASGELSSYVESDLDRFLITLNLAESVSWKNGLEIGGNPYFLSMLLHSYKRNASMKRTNFFGGEAEERSQTVEINSDLALRTGLASKIEMKYHNVNLETTPLPFKERSFDMVFFCEVLEHFTEDPWHALSEINRVISDGGYLLLTTPNVCREENVARILLGHNIYDPYSGYGPHGRHNREYTRHEVANCLTACGFAAVDHFTADVHPRALSLTAVQLARLTEARGHDLGMYQFHLWRKISSSVGLRPSWLYRSMNCPLDAAPL